MDEPKVVEAVMVAASTLNPRMRVTVERIEDAMRAAIEKCLADGVPIGDSATIKAAMMKARQDVLDEVVEG